MSPNQKFRVSCTLRALLIQNHHGLLCESLQQNLEDLIKAFPKLATEASESIYCQVHDV